MQDREEGHQILEATPPFQALSASWQWQAMRRNRKKKMDASFRTIELTLGDKTQVGQMMAFISDDSVCL